jgi:hypothetical protein
MVEFLPDKDTFGNRNFTTWQIRRGCGWVVEIKSKKLFTFEKYRLLFFITR